MPLVSVIIPTFNRAHTIKRALRSVAEQTVQDLEILVVDDASTDNTAAIIEQLGDPRVRYFRHEKNQFAGGSRNTGMAAATGRFIAFLDSDDAWLPNKLQLQIELLEGADQHCGCSYTGAIVNAEGGLRKSTVYRPSINGNALQAYLLGKFTIWTPTFLFRAEMLDKVAPFDPALIRVEDVDFYLRMLQQCELSCISEPLAELFIDMSKDIAELAEESDRIFLAKHRELIHQQGHLLSRSIYATYDFRIGERYLNEGKVITGLRNIGKAILKNPFQSPKRYTAMLIKLCRAILK